MTEQSDDPKVKIIQVARILFAENGFEGTSIRDIASAAEVNVASINYHFNNKENLFNEILLAGYNECAKSVRDFYDETSPNLEETLLYVFRYFLNKSPDLMSHFKMIMSSRHDNLPCGNEGPPGGDVIVMALQKELGFAIPDRDLHWALKSLFSFVTHTSLLYECHFKRSSIPFSSVEDLEESIVRLTKVVVNELKLLKKGS